MVKLVLINILRTFVLVLFFGCATNETWNRIDGGSFYQNWLEGNEAQCDAEAGKI
jgi:hypothetical protein